MTALLTVDVIVAVDAITMTSRSLERTCVLALTTLVLNLPGSNDTRAVLLTIKAACFVRRLGGILGFLDLNFVDSGGHTAHDACDDAD